MKRIAIAQTTSTDDVGHNVEVARRLTEQAAAAGADLVAFPEVVFFVGARRRKLEIAEPVDGPLVEQFRRLAERERIHILLGSIHERIIDDQERVYNTSILIGNRGEILATYRKLKLFNVDIPQIRIKENDTIRPGESPPPVVETDLGRIGLTICFDLRFPELYQDLRERGAQLVFVPSNFTVPTGSAHWEILLRARAIENQFYVAAPAQEGRHNPRYESYGHSLLIDPWGKTLAEAGPGDTLIYGEIDLDYLNDVRRRLPVGALQSR